VRAKELNHTMTFKCNITTLGIALVLSWLSVSTVFSQEIQESAFALQSRKYHLKHEFYVAPGLLPLDAFQKSVIGNLSYTYHINDGWGLELAQFAYAYNVDTGLQDKLERLFGATAADLNPLKYYGSVNAVVKPIYRKMILFNRTILHGETFFVAGGGAFKFQKGFKSAADVGIGFRVFLNDWASVRFDGRDFLCFSGGVKNVIMLTLGMSFNLGKG
jgi:outer membrane beta-barrel protein